MAKSAPKPPMNRMPPAAKMTAQMQQHMTGQAMPMAPKPTRMKKTRPTMRGGPGPSY